MHKGILVAGCGNSGTSLTHALLGRHSLIYPIEGETGFLCFGGKGEIPIPHTGEPPDIYLKRIADMYDHNAVQAGCRFWVEKTPPHIRHIDKAMQHRVSDKVILTVRCPLENIASLKERTGNFQYSIDRYVADNTHLLEWISHKHVYIMHLELLQAFPSLESAKLQSFMGLPKQDLTSTQKLVAQRSPYDPKAEHLEHRAWQISQPITRRRCDWEKILSEDEASAIQDACYLLARQLGYDSISGFSALAE